MWERSVPSVTLYVKKSSTDGGATALLLDLRDVPLEDILRAIDGDDDGHDLTLYPLDINVAIDALAGIDSVLRQKPSMRILRSLSIFFPSSINSLVASKFVFVASSIL